jgi:hypothetical protein
VHARAFILPMDVRAKAAEAQRTPITPRRRRDAASPLLGSTSH